MNFMARERRMALTPTPTLTQRMGLFTTGTMTRRRGSLKYEHFIASQFLFSYIMYVWVGQGYLENKQVNGP